MLEKPNLPDKKIIACLQDEYGVKGVWVTFLPLGADPNTVIYQVVTDERKSYFLKVRLGNFDETSGLLAKFLKDQGIEQIIAPIVTRDHQLWLKRENLNLMLYPFVEGRDGFAVKLSDRQWLDFGMALKSVHTVKIPPALKKRLHVETYAPQWRDRVKAFLVWIHDETFDEPTAAKLAAFLKIKQEEIFNVVERTERLGLLLQGRSMEFVLCHYDIHAGNVLLDRIVNSVTTLWCFIKVVGVYPSYGGSHHAEVEMVGSGMVVSGLTFCAVDLLLDLLEAGFYFSVCAVVLDDLLNSEIEVSGKERDSIGRYDVAKEK
jgi:spectinomycin phosphotransferase